MRSLRSGRPPVRRDVLSPLRALGIPAAGHDIGYGWRDAVCGEHHCRARRDNVQLLDKSHRMVPPAQGSSHHRCCPAGRVSSVGQHDVGSDDQFGYGRCRGQVVVQAKPPLVGGCRSGVAVGDQAVLRLRRSAHGSQAEQRRVQDLRPATGTPNVDHTVGGVCAPSILSLTLAVMPMGTVSSSCHQT